MIKRFRYTYEEEEHRRMIRKLRHNGYREVGQIEDLGFGSFYSFRAKDDQEDIAYHIIYIERAGFEGEVPRKVWGSWQLRFDIGSVIEEKAKRN